MHTPILAIHNHRSIISILIMVLHIRASERASEGSDQRLTYYNGILLLNKNSQRFYIILNSNKTAKMAFFKHAKRHHKNVRQYQQVWKNLGFCFIGNLRFSRTPVFKAIRVIYTTTTIRVRLIGGRVSSQNIQDTEFSDHASEKNVQIAH